MDDTHGMIDERLGNESIAIHIRWKKIQKKERKKKKIVKKTLI